MKHITILKHHLINFHLLNFPLIQLTLKINQSKIIKLNHFFDRFKISYLKFNFIMNLLLKFKHENFRQLLN